MPEASSLDSWKARLQESDKKFYMNLNDLRIQFGMPPVNYHFDFLEDQVFARTIFVKIHNEMYPISYKELNQVFSRFGTLDDVVRFSHGHGFHSKIYFDNMESTLRAFEFLNGRNIYDHCCTLELFLVQYFVVEPMKAEIPPQKELQEFESPRQKQPQELESPPQKQQDIKVSEKTTDEVHLVLYESSLEDLSPSQTDLKVLPNSSLNFMAFQIEYEEIRVWVVDVVESIGVGLDDVKVNSTENLEINIAHKVFEKMQVKDMTSVNNSVELLNSLKDAFRSMDSISLFVFDPGKSIEFPLHKKRLVETYSVDVGNSHFVVPDHELVYEDGTSMLFELFVDNCGGVLSESCRDFEGLAWMVEE